MFTDPNDVVISTTKPMFYTVSEFNDGLSTGAIVGISIAGIAVIGVTTGLTWWYFAVKRKGK